jgi:hypothetical protein
MVSGRSSKVASPRGSSTGEETRGTQSSPSGPRRDRSSTPSRLDAGELLSPVKRPRVRLKSTANGRLNDGLFLSAGIGTDHT